MRNRGAGRHEQRRNRRGWGWPRRRRSEVSQHAPAEARGTLAEVSPGERVRVKDIRGSGPLVQRIMLLGVLPGAELFFVRRALTGDPLEVQVNGSSLSLRTAEARTIQVETI